MYAATTPRFWTTIAPLVRELRNSGSVCTAVHLLARAADEREALEVPAVGLEQRHVEALDAAVGLELPVELDDLAEHVEALGLPPGHNGAPSDEQPVVCHA